MATLISEADKKILNAYTAMIPRSMKETAAMPNTPESGLKVYRAIIRRSSPNKFPLAYKA